MIEPIIDSRVIEQLSKLLKSARHIVITCHLSPDGDALGSTLGLCRVLRNMGKDAYVVVPDQVPRALQFIPAVRDVVVYTMAQLRGRFLVRNADLIFCLDFNTLRRIDNRLWAVRPPRRKNCGATSTNSTTATPRPSAWPAVPSAG